MIIKTFLGDLKKRYDEPSASLLLMLLLIGDFAFFIIASINELSDLENYLFSLDNEGSYPEVYQYTKWLWISSLFLYLSKKWETIKFSLWTLFFTYLLFDDALGIHENIGGVIANYLTITPPFGLRPQDVGELAVTATAGIILFSLIFWAYLLGSQVFKRISIEIFLLILILVLFGVFVDILDIALPVEGRVQGVLWFIEDGGEMLVASIICWYVYFLCIADKNDKINNSGFIH